MRVQETEESDLHEISLMRPSRSIHILGFFGRTLCLGPVVTYRVSAVRLHGGIVSYHGIYGAQNTRLLRLPDGRPLHPGQSMTTEALHCRRDSSRQRTEDEGRAIGQDLCAARFCCQRTVCTSSTATPGTLSQAGDLLHSQERRLWWAGGCRTILYNYICRISLSTSNKYLYSVHSYV